MTSNDVTNLRKFDRVQVEIRAGFNVLIPEDTFQALEYESKVLDLSERGAMVQVALDTNVYSSMLQRTRYCRLTFKDLDELPQKVTGRAVWLQPCSGGSGRVYRIGLFFEDCPPEVVSRLREYVAKYKKS